MLGYIFCAQLLIHLALGKSCPDAPGSSSRPILYASEAEKYTQENYFAALNSGESDWYPESLTIPSSADYTVGSSGQDGVTHSSIQQAVNAAVDTGSTERKYIRILSGTYREAIFIPKTSVPITLFGSGNPEDVHIVLNISAQTTVEEYAQIVNPNGERYQSGDAAYSMYQYCSGRSSTVGTSCSSVVWTQNEELQIINLTIENEAEDAQAVAIFVNADRSHLENVRLVGHQDTLEAGKNAERIYVSNSYISGDVDFIFGTARLVVANSQIHARADRHGSAAVVAPNTNADVKYGFLITNSNLTSDSTFHETKKAILGRSWDSSSSANGQAVIRDSDIDAGYNLSKPWSAMRSDYAGNTNANRDLDDPNYNRLWEYNTTEPDD